jgi:hypothetical protein
MMYKLRSRLSEELWSLRALIVRLPEGGRSCGCGHFSAVKGW